MEPSATTRAGGTLTVDEFVDELKAKLDAVEIDEDGQEIPASTSTPLAGLDADLARLLDGDPGSLPSPFPEADVPEAQVEPFPRVRVADRGVLMVEIAFRSCGEFGPLLFCRGAICVGDRRPN